MRFSPSCNCCNECVCCPGAAPASLFVTFSGSNGLGNCCAIANGTPYELPFIGVNSGTCVWRYTEGSVNSGPPICSYPNPDFPTVTMYVCRLVVEVQCLTSSGTGLPAWLVLVQMTVKSDGGNAALTTCDQLFTSGLCTLSSGNLDAATYGTCDPVTVTVADFTNTSLSGPCFYTDFVNCAAALSAAVTE